MAKDNSWNKATFMAIVIQTLILTAFLSALAVLVNKRSTEVSVLVGDWQAMTNDVKEANVLNTVITSIDQYQEKFNSSEIAEIIHKASHVIETIYIFSQNQDLTTKMSILLDKAIGDVESIRALLAALRGQSP